MNYEEKYKKLVEAIKELRDINSHDKGIRNWINDNVPELAESDDERIRRALITYFYGFPYNCLEKAGTNPKEAIAWLEKQESVDRDRLAKGVLKGVANSIMQWIDANVTKGNMCLSNMECEDIENSVINAYWSNIYGYMKKKLEKQGEKTQGKTAIEAIKEEKVDNQNCAKDDDKIGQKFKVGDIVQYITDSTDRRKIEEIDTLCNMYHTDSSPIMFEIEDEWKVVVNAEDVEQKSADNAKPKFHEGDWVVRGDTIAQILDIQEQYYIGIDINGKDFTSSRFLNDDKIHLWTIADAKPGDVLYYKSDNNIEYIVMNKGINMHGNIDSYFRYNSLDGFAVDVPSVLSAENDNITLATKEQRDLLFSKMRESGYEWDAENKVLKKISISMNKEDLIKRVDEIDHILFGLNANEALIVLAATTTLVIETMVSSDKHSEVTKTLENMFNEIKKQN